MPILRVYVILALVFACTWIYFFNLRIVATRFREFIKDTDAVDEEFWSHFGLESTCKKVIRDDLHGVGLDDLQAYRSNLLIRRRHTFADVQIPALNLDINKSDVLVIVHTQKTGGTYLEDNLVLNTNIQPPVLCTEMPGVAYRGVDFLWFIQAQIIGTLNDVIYTHGSGLSCYHYITMIRDPVTRFISEWLHVRRGATWKESRLFCDGRDATLEEVPFCFKHGTWKNVSFDEFLNCSSNMAFNRQTRMLANLSFSDCYRLQSSLTQEQRDDIMLQSAKDNLARFLTFFGILEKMEESQKLFERTFVGLKFRKNLINKKSYAVNYAVVSESHWVRAVEKNNLDVRLYQYAKDIFLQRLQMANITLAKRAKDAVIVSENFRYRFVPET